MTTPHERFRALQMARDLLLAVQEDPLVSLVLREHAAAVLSTYPSEQLLRALIAEDLIGLPNDVAVTLSSCSSLFHAGAGEVRWQGSPETMNNFRRVSRHFPYVGELAQLRDLRLNADRVAHFADGISSWISADEPATLRFGRTGSASATTECVERER